MSEIQDNSDSGDEQGAALASGRLSQEYINGSLPSFESAMQGDSSLDLIAQTSSPLPNFDVFVAPSPPPLAGGCSPSPDFVRIIDKAAANIYDVKGLGDIDAAKKAFCDTGNPKDAVDRANEILARTGDPYNSMFRSQKALDLEGIFAGRIRGIGIDFQIPNLDATTRKPKNGPFIINEVLPGTPAERANLKEGDVISGIDGVDASHFSFDELLAVLQNPEQKSVNLTIMRDGQARELAIVPEELTVPAVTHRSLGDGIAYLKVDDFMQRDTVDEMKAAIEHYKGAKGFVIDLRDNTGGLFEPGVQGASLFVDQGTLLSMRSRRQSDPKHPEYESTFYNLKDGEISVETGFGFSGTEKRSLKRFEDLVDVPTVFLVNGMTASSGEIFASAVQENGDAKVVGSRTYGKGIGQALYDGMPDGSMLRVTNFRYYSPKGNWFGDAHKERIGVSPDLEVDNPNDALRLSSADAQFHRGLQVLRRDIAEREK